MSSPSKSFFQVDFHAPESLKEIQDTVNDMKAYIKGRESLAPSVSQSLLAIEKLVAIFKSKRAPAIRLRQLGERIAFFKSNVFDPVYETEADPSDIYTSGYLYYDALAVKLASMAASAKGQKDPLPAILAGLVNEVRVFRRDLDQSRQAKNGKSPER